MATVSIFLFGKPAWELPEKYKKEELPEILKGIGNNIKERMDEVSSAIQLLMDNGWKIEMLLYDIEAYKDISDKKAEKELKKLGIYDLVTILDIE